MKKFIIITSIFAPTEAVREFALRDGWQLVVVGDKKSPTDWSSPGVTYLSPDDQEKLGFQMTSTLPWNHYCRKMIGYLYAIKNGAEVIADTDDDNIPLENWAPFPFEGEYSSIGGEGFVNIYKLFTDQFIWPRGLPLQYVMDDSPKPAEQKKAQKVGVWQMLANEDPDVDAIYRLTSNKMVNFDKREPVVLDKGLVSPFNSQNTVYRRELFPLLYLPAFVTFRFTDILRGLVAQPVLWNAGFTLGFGEATVVQKRNPHDYMKDFESEIPVYLHSEKSFQLAAGAILPGASVSDNLLNAYKALHEAGIVQIEEVRLLEAWLSDLESMA